MNERVTPTPGNNFGEDRTDLGVPFRYRVDPEKLGSMAEKFLPLTLDSEGEAFVASSLSRKYRKSALLVHRLLTLFLSDFDTNALLRVHPVFLLSTPQAQRLLGETSQSTLLDIGAGSGDVTTRLAPLVERLVCTETSRGMSRRLRRRGLECWTGAAGEQRTGDPLRAHRFDLISLFNVVDRCARPRTLLRAAVEHLPPGGKLIVATPLPFDPFYYQGSRTQAPEERLAIESSTWEKASLELLERELLPLGLEVQSLSRAPYLSGGNANHPLFLLDDVIVVCRKVAVSSNSPSDCAPRPHG